MALQNTPSALQNTPSASSVDHKKREKRLLSVALVFAELKGQLKKRVEHIDPFTNKDIELKGSLGQLLETTEGIELKHLYPNNIPLKEAFTKYNNTQGSDTILQEDGNGRVYIGRSINFKLRRLEITSHHDDDDDDCSECDYSEYSNQHSVSVFSPTSTMNPSSVSTVMSQEQPFSPEESSLPLEYPRGSLLLTELLSTDPQLPQTVDSTSDSPAVLSMPCFPETYSQGLEIPIIPEDAQGKLEQLLSNLTGESLVNNWNIAPENGDSI